MEFREGCLTVAEQNVMASLVLFRSPGALVRQMHIERLTRDDGMRMFGVVCQIAVKLFPELTKDVEGHRLPTQENPFHRWLVALTMFIETRPKEGGQG